VDLARLTELVESSDLGGLIRLVGTLARDGDWDGIVTVRDRCREAVRRGKEVWGPAEYAEYRLARDAPGSYAAMVVADGKGRFGLGPLWEVAASTHAWAELEPHLEVATTRALAAHERVVRGEDLTDAGVDREVLDIPLRLEPWEPRYPVAVYREDRADFPEAPASPLGWCDLPEPGERLRDAGPGEALLELVRPWWEESSGHAEAVQVEGPARRAIRTLGPHRARLAEVSLQEALSAMVWAGASGGAYGRRRGTPVGRAGAWWVLVELLGWEELPAEGEELAREAGTLRWVRWDPGDLVGGWSLHLAVEDPLEGVAWAISAVDVR